MTLQFHYGRGKSAYFKLKSGNRLSCFEQVHLVPISGELLTQVEAWLPDAAVIYLSAGDPSKLRFNQIIFLINLLLPHQLFINASGTGIMEPLLLQLTLGKWAEITTLLSLVTLKSNHNAIKVTREDINQHCNF